MVLASGTGSARPRPEKAHEGEPILDQEFGALVREAVARLQDQDLEHEHVVERQGGHPLSRATRGTAWARSGRNSSKSHQSIQPLQGVALGRELLQALIQIEEPDLTSHPPPPPARTRQRESHRAPNREVLGGAQLSR